MVFSDRGTPLGLRPDTVLVNGRPHLVTTSGAVVQPEEGQAGGGALMAQNGSLVFYLLQVNDVWAYFNTGMKDNNITNPDADRHSRPRARSRPDHHLRATGAAAVHEIRLPGQRRDDR